MLLHCETEDGSAGRGAGLAAGWLRPETLETLIEHLGLRQIQALAEAHPEWLRPRWPTRVRVWRELLLAAAAGEAPALERARLHGLTLLAAEARGSLPARADPGRGTG